MDDQSLEKKLEAAWDPTPPDGMRERVLAKAIQELPRKPEPARRRIFTWQVALSMAAVMTVIVCNTLDNRWMGGESMPPMSAQTCRALHQQRMEFAQAPGDWGGDTSTESPRGWYR